jgi:hypothetical protein
MQAGGSGVRAGGLPGPECTHCSLFHGSCVIRDVAWVRRVVVGFAEVSFLVCARLCPFAGVRLSCARGALQPPVFPAPRSLQYPHVKVRAEPVLSSMVAAAVAQIACVHTYEGPKPSKAAVHRPKRQLAVSCYPPLHEEPGPL